MKMTTGGPPRKKLTKECRYPGSEEGRVHACNNHNGICDWCYYYKTPKS